MNFETTALFGECKRILESTSDPSLFFYRMEIYTPYGTHNPAKLLSIDINSDYVRQYAPKIIATFMISYGEFTHRIRPYYQDLTVTITKSPDQLYRGPVGIDMQRYRAILVAIPPEPNITGQVQGRSADFGDLTNMVEVQLELQEFLLEDIRAITTGTTIQSSTPADALRAMITAYTARVGLSREEAPVSFDMQPPNNVTPQTHISIPHSVELTSLADFLQTKGGGIYNYDIASFLERGCWYVWSPFDTSRQDYVEDTLVLLLAPVGKYPGVEHTYRTTSRQTIVMVTGDRQHIDDTQNDLYDVGNGIRFLDAVGVMEGFDTVEGNRVTVDRSKNATEIIYAPNPTGKVRMRTVQSSSNIYHELSKVSPSKGSYLTVVWENANNDLIRPDMNVQVMMAVGGVTSVHQARILASSTFIQNTGNGMMSNRYSTTVTLALFVEDTFGRAPIPNKEI